MKKLCSTRAAPTPLLAECNSKLEPLSSLYEIYIAYSSILAGMIMYGVHNCIFTRYVVKKNSNKKNRFKKLASKKCIIF